jgi:hypothetical protein
MWYKMTLANSRVFYVPEKTVNNLWGNVLPMRIDRIQDLHRKDNGEYVPCPSTFINFSQIVLFEEE